VQKLRYFLIIILFPFSVLSQQRTKIIVEHYEASTTNVADKNNSVSYLRKPTFRQDNATLTCDSAVFYATKNIFDAFGSVHINQADTINIYSDFLNYNGNTKIAHLTSNVRMIDKESILTTNILDYNMASKIGTYVSGGKIVNKEVTLTSRNGWYFSSSRDAFFKYNVLVVTPESRITSDTMKYNTLSNWAYFYGPTNIKGKDDNLYTENGAYNTKTQYAYFGKKNLYTTGTKSLKGDSLYYDGIAGYGKAVRNIVFKDTADKTVMYGQLGYYYKIDQRTIVTKNPYIGMGTADSVKVNNKLQPDSLWMGADTLETQMVLKKSLVLISSPVIKKDNELGEEEKDEVKEQKVGAKKPKAKATEETTAPKRNGKKDKKNAKTEKEDAKNPDKDVIPRDSLSKDSLSKDSISIPKKAPPLLKDTLLKTLKTDTILIRKGKDSLSKLVKTVPLAKTGIPAAKTGIPAAKQAVNQAQTKKPLVKDSIPFNPEDTVRTRIIKAYHHVRVYKANMQAKADSLFYTSADSTLRWYRDPILWSEGSQQTGDTIYLQLKNKKLNTLQVLQNAFLVNVNADSARYNQIKGRLITAFFKEGKLKNMFVDGNAESIYFNQDDKSIYTDMNQTVSSRIKILFKEKQIERIVTIKEPEGVRTPIPELKEDVFLTGFIWRPEQRPLSKKEVISGKPKAKPGAKKAVPVGAGKTPGKGDQPVTEKDSTALKIKEVTDGAKGVIDKVIKSAPELLKDSSIVAPALPKTLPNFKILPKKEVKTDSVKPAVVPLKK
jgi:lipopolysaccharide export system protein LptA